MFIYLCLYIYLEYIYISLNVLSVHPVPSKQRQWTSLLPFFSSQISRCFIINLLIIQEGEKEEEEEEEEGGVKWVYSGSTAFIFRMWTPAAPPSPPPSFPPIKTQPPSSSWWPFFIIILFVLRRFQKEKFSVKKAVSKKYMLKIRNIISWEDDLTSGGASIEGARAPPLLKCWDEEEKEEEKKIIYPVKKH